MRQGMLLGFVEELGHEYNNLLEGVVEEEAAVPDKTAVFAANAHFQDLLNVDDEGEEEDDDDDNDDDNDNDNDDDDDDNDD